MKPGQAACSAETEPFARRDRPVRATDVATSVRSSDRID